MATPSTADIPGFEISNRDDSASKIGYGGQIWVHASGDSTGGAFGMWEGLLPPGGSSPIHIHHKEDEYIFVMEGTLLFVCGDRQWESGPSTWVKLPKDITHGFRTVGARPVHFLEFFVPAGLEQLFNYLPEIKPDIKLDMAKILAVANRFGLEFLGPMPPS